MRYALLICNDESAMLAVSPEEAQASMAEYMKWGEDMAKRGVLQGGERLRTPHLHIAYAPRDFTAMRETGASWKVMPPGTPENKGIAPIGERK